MAISATEAGTLGHRNQSPATAIRAEGLSKVYRLGNVSISALRDVTLSIASGEMVCIMGRSGSGKSTILRQLSLIDRPTDGRLEVDGRDVLALGESARADMRLRRLGYVFQEYALIPELTAEENVYLPAMMLGKRPAQYRDRAVGLLAAVGLGDHLRHRPRELSGGQQQRVAIARALVNEPAIIFADEPTANLDSMSGRTVMETLARLNREVGVTIVFVSHDQGESEYAGRVIYLSDGAIVATPVAATPATGA